MATAKKLPSGSWRCLVYSHSEPVFDKAGKPVMDPKTGKQKEKRIYESFTSDNPTKEGKREAEMLAAEFAAGKEKKKRTRYTVADAINQYISSKSNVISPSTLKLYKGYEKLYFDNLGQIPLEKLTESDIQFWVSGLVTSSKGKKRTPKTVRNIHALLGAALEMYYPEFRYRVTLPEKDQKQLYVPSDADIKILLDNLKDPDLEIAILLAAFGPLRRGEICALTSDDIHGNLVTVNKSVVLDENNNWVIKAPKKYSSFRTVELPDLVIQKMQGRSGRIIDVNPSVISDRFRDYIRTLNLENVFRFHDLRHYSASIMHAIGIPDVYIMQRGGWATDHVMKTVYRNAIDEEAKKNTSKILNHFSNLPAMQHEMQHEQD